MSAYPNATANTAVVANFFNLDMRRVDKTGNGKLFVLLLFAPWADYHVTAYTYANITKSNVVLRTLGTSFANSPALPLTQLPLFIVRP